MRIRKALLSLALAFILFTACLTACAEASEPMAFYEVGVTMDWPESFVSMPGIAYPSSTGLICKEPDIYALLVYYLPQTVEAYSSGESCSVGALGYVLSTDADDATFKATMPSLLSESADASILDSIQFIAEAEGYRFYFMNADNGEYLASIGEEYAAAYPLKRQAFLDLLGTATFYAPKTAETVNTGKSFSFEAVDMDGNAVTSEALFSANRITMVNLWATWCPYCIYEMPELVNIHAQLQEMGCGIVGILMDNDPDAVMDEARGIVAENGLTYPNVIRNTVMADIVDRYTGLPSTLFVDSTGTVVGKAIIGAAVSEYLPAVQALLDAEDAAPEAAAVLQSAIAEEPAVYRVIVSDAEGSPVEGVAVQFCSTQTCTLATTDADGVATFDMPDAEGYTVHVLQAPEGYAGDDTEYTAPATHGDVRITLKKAE